MKKTELKKDYLLECCVDSAASAMAAQRGGADRLELCDALVIGGITPSPALLKQVKQTTQLPVYPLIRPRFGDFLYTEEEFALMRAQIQMLKAAGADGFVIGALLPDGSLHTAALARLIDETGTLPITLHRAFDMCRQPFEALKQAADLGISTILTSGQKNCCTDGIPLLQSLCGYDARIRIMAGAGVNADVICQLLSKTQLTAFHMSGKRVLESQMKYRNPHVSMGAAGLDEYALWQTDEEEIRKARQVLIQKASGK